MRDRELQEVRRVLLARQRNLRHRRNAMLAEEDHLLAERETELEDLATERTAADLLEHLSESDRALLERIDRALARIEDGSYGSCAACGAHIPRARLEAMPEADRCVACAAAH